MNALTLSTHNGNDRWPDFLSHRLDEQYGDRVSVVTQAMSGNAVVSEAIGEPAIKRLQRDVLEVSGVTTVILMEGANDIGSAQNTPEPVIEGYKEIATRLKAAGITVIAGTLPPACARTRTFPRPPSAVSTARFMAEPRPMPTASSSTNSSAPRASSTA